jgi:chemotaxis protein methyltransferase CheR
MTAALRLDEFVFIADFLKTRSGLALTADKLYLIESRLQPIARAQGYADVSDLIARMRAGSVNAAVQNEIIEAMTTNESSFFRDTKPFDIFAKQAVPKLRELYPSMQTLRLWSSACSTGQEAYSLAIAFKEEEAKYGGLKCDILGTDIADKVIERARKAHYTQFEVQRGLPIQYLLKYFKQQPDNVWELSELIRQMATFKNVNLLAPLTGLGMFEVIFCRNVLIYFDEKTKTDVMNRMADVLVAGGFLFLGSAESTLGLSSRFKPVEGMNGVFTKV